MLKNKVFIICLTLLLLVEVHKSTANKSQPIYLSLLGFSFNKVGVSQVLIQHRGLKELTK